MTPSLTSLLDAFTSQRAAVKLQLSIPQQARLSLSLLDMHVIWGATGGGPAELASCTVRCWVHGSSNFTKIQWRNQSKLTDVRIMQHFRQ